MPLCSSVRKLFAPNYLQCGTECRPQVWCFETKAKCYFPPVVSSRETGRRPAPQGADTAGFDVSENFLHQNVCSVELNAGPKFGALQLRLSATFLP